MDEGRLWTKCSICRFVVAFHRFGTPRLLVESLSFEFDSSNGQFDSAFHEVDSSFCEVVSSTCQFDSSAGLFDSSFYEFDSSLTTSVCRFDVSFRRFDSGYNSTLTTSSVFHFPALIHDLFIHNRVEMDSLKSYLCHSIEFVLNRLNDRFHESDGIRYLVTHIDRILYILSHASSLFNIPPQLECSLQRAHQMLVTLSGDDNSLQRRLFSGCRGRPSIDIPRELLELYLEKNFTPELIARLFCVSSKTI